MSILFEPVTINAMEVANRFVRSATGGGRADQGRVTDQHIKLFSELADGGIGLIITGLACVHPDGRISPTHLCAYSDDFAAGLKKIADGVHGRGGKIALQLFCGGRESATFLKTENRQAKGVSLVDKDPYFTGHYASMTEDDIREIIRAFGDAARRAQQAGLDAVQLHGAHAYLLAQFLSPFTNRRKDDWGGCLENRLRLHREILKDIRSKVGGKYPVFIKLGVQDGFEGGLEFNEGLQAAKLLAQYGYDALEISQGLRGAEYEGTEFRTRINSIDREGYFRNWCREVKNHVDVPVMMVGGLRDIALMEEVIQNKEADFVSLCRPFIRQPGLVNEWKQGNRLRPSCISCNRCLVALKNREQTRCVQEEIEAKGPGPVPRA